MPSKGPAKARKTPRRAKMGPKRANEETKSRSRKYAPKRVRLPPNCRASSWKLEPFCQGTPLLTSFA